MDGNERIQYKLKATRDNVNKMIDNEDDELETHFVENPFIKLREKAQQRQRDAKIRLGEAQLVGASGNGDAEMNE